MQPQRAKWVTNKCSCYRLFMGTLHATHVHRNVRFKLTTSHILFVFLSEGKHIIVTTTEDRAEFILFRLMALNSYL